MILEGTSECKVLESAQAFITFASHKPGICYAYIASVTNVNIHQTILYRLKVVLGSWVLHSRPPGLEGNPKCGSPSAS